MTRVALIGAGLIGGSIGLRLRTADPGAEVAVWDLGPGVAAAAVGRHAATRACGSLPEAVADADIVIVATPVDAYEALLEEIAATAPATAVVTDVGSTKAGAVALGSEHLGGRFVGGHPMAGSERHGIEAADPELFEDAWWILTPTEDTSSAAYRRVSALVASLGAKPISLDARVHDDLVARLSHLPQIVASAVVEVAAAGERQETLLGLAAGGFRDVTRIAASRPDLWVSIVRSNSEAVLEALGKLGGRLGELEETIRLGKWDDLEGFFARARDARVELFAKKIFVGEPVALTLLIPDKPGVLAEVTREAGELGANIEDIQIFHSTEGGRGRLELVVAGHEAAAALTERLIALGYHVEMGLPE